MVSSRRWRFADILAGVDVDRYQRLSLVDHDVSTALRPDLGLQGVVDLILNPKVLVSGVVFVYSLMRLTSEGWKRCAKRTTRSYSSSVSTQICEKSAFTWSAQHTLHQVEVVINQCRRLAALGAGFDLSPQMLEETDVGAQLVFLDVGGCGTHDEATQSRFRARW